MKEVYSHEFSVWQKVAQKLLGMWRINRDSIDFKWGYFAPDFGLEFIVNRGGYFDPRYSITFCFIWGRFNIKLPFKTSLGEGCNLPRYGIQVHDGTFWIHYGGKYDESIGQVTDSNWITWYLPWFTWHNHQLEIKDINGLWIKEGDKYDFDWRDKVAHKTKHDYTYIRDSGEVQNRIVTMYEKRRTWSRKWFPWVKKSSHSISFEFNDEVGERSGSWKGGVIGSGYEVKKGETAIQCLRRMEKERKF